MTCRAISDPGGFALKNAVRAAIVVPIVFAISLELIGLAEMALFAGFGSIALLVFVDFGGAWRPRLSAYLALIAWHWHNISYLDKPPYPELAILTLGLPAVAAAGAWFLGRAPKALARRPLE